MSAFANGDICASAAVVSLRGNNLEVVLTKCHVVRAPRVEMITHRNGAARTLVLTHAPILFQSGGSRNSGQAAPYRCEDGVGAAIRIDCALDRRRTLKRRVVRPVVLDDVVLDEWVRRPAVDGQVAVTGLTKVGGVLDRPVDKISV